MRSVCHIELLKTLYYALVSSKLEYGLCVWGGTYLVILQKCFVRLIFNKHKLDHTKQLFKTSNILPLRELYIFKVLREFFSRSGDNQLDSKRIRTRRDLDIIVPKPNLTLYKKCYAYLAPKLYNMLPEAIKIIRNQNQFQKSVKRFLINHRCVENLFATIV